MGECMTQEDAENMSNEQAANILIPLRDMMRDQNGCPISNAYFALDKAVDALRVKPLRKMGKWMLSEMYESDHVAMICSECGATYDKTVAGCFFNYCPVCGADMRGDSDEA